ncbi:class I SAM-dependent methyltransferase [Candidatus Woesearchaeota archaeon]|nr:class I SAM-dependent methyltransferase [Candidatus Woesearchaeota archaeon]
MNPETSFLIGLMKLQYGLRVKSRLRTLSSRIPWAKGWPENNSSFWNAEAFMWNHKIEKEKRELITQKLSFLREGKNLDLGCGSYSYLPSVGVDFSEKMLQFNGQLTQKVVGDLEKKLPFNHSEFDSVTAVFVLNYIKNYGKLLQEIKQVLKKGGTLMVVLYSRNINNWQQQKEVNHCSVEEWKDILISQGFRVSLSIREGLWFFKGINLK